MQIKRLLRHCQNKNEWLKCGACLVWSVIGVSILHNQVQFIVSETDSLPYHYFVVFKNIKPKRPDYTVIESDWQGQKIIKQIIGQAGDTIRLDEQGYYWVNQSNLGPALKKASNGRSLHPIRSQVIPKGYVFLGGNHPRSFDSRYQELGLVRELDLKGWAVPLG